MQERLHRSRRLRGRSQYKAVLATRRRRTVGPLTLCIGPNHLAKNRLGLVVSRRVGIAARRNRIKRLLREAFRLNQHQWPAGYDLVVIVRPHEPAHLPQYEHWLAQAITLLA